VLRYGDKDIKPSVSTASDSQNSSPGPQSMQDVASYPSTSTVDMQDVLATTSTCSNGINGNTIVMIDDDMPSMSLLVAGDGASAQNVDDLLLPDFDFQYIDGLDSDMSQSFQQYCPTSQGFVSFIAAEVNIVTFLSTPIKSSPIHATTITNILYAHMNDPDDFGLVARIEYSRQAFFCCRLFFQIISATDFYHFYTYY